MPPALSPSQLELLRHCFQYNDTSTFYRAKLSVADIQDLVQCGHAIVSRKRKLWDKTGDVEKFRTHQGRQRSLDDHVEQAVVQVFLQNVDITMEEALDWVEEEFEKKIGRTALIALLRRNRVSYKRLKFIAAQRNPTLRADYLLRVEDFYDDQLVFLDESAANEFTKDRKFGWSMVGCPAVKERDLRRSERWSILPAYTKDGYMAWKIFQGSYTKQIFNQFVYTEVLPRMNAYSGDRPPRSVLVMDNARIHCSEELQQMCNDVGVLLVYLPPYSPDYNPIEQSFNQIKQWMRKYRDKLQHCDSFEDFFEWALEDFNVTGDPGSHFRHAGYTRQRPESSQMYLETVE
jgi:transposase